MAGFLGSVKKIPIFFSRCYCFSDLWIFPSSLFSFCNFSVFWILCNSWWKSSPCVHGSFIAHELNGQDPSLLCEWLRFFHLSCHLQLRGPLKYLESVRISICCLCTCVYGVYEVMKVKFASAGRNLLEPKIPEFCQFLGSGMKVTGGSGFVPRLAWI